MTRPQTILAAALCAAALAGGQARADATLTMNVAMPRTSSFFLGLYQPWKEAVERESGGHIKIDMPAASLAPLDRQWDVVASGVADVAMSPERFHPPAGQAAVPRRDAVHRAQLDRRHASRSGARSRNIFDAAHEYKGVKLLGMWVNGGNTLMTVSRPVTKLEDFKGLKLWVATPNMKAAIDAFGATPVPSAGSSNMFDYVSGGIVDGTRHRQGLADLVPDRALHQAHHHLRRAARLQRLLVLHEPEGL